MFRFRLKELREKYNLSQYDLVKELHINQSTIGMWENGKNHPRQSMLVQIAQLFDVSVDYLLGTDSTMSNTVADNHGIIGVIGNNNAPVSVNNGNAHELTTQEKDLLRIYNTLSGELQTELMQFVYKIEKKGNDLK